MDGYFVERSQDYLTHHGILGQKWGKRNGPPYPLGASDHSSSEKNAGWRKSINNGRNEKLYYRVGKSYKDPNKSGVLYVSQNTSDANRYIKNLGPSLIGKLMGNYGTHIQTLSPNTSIKTASDRETNYIIAKHLYNNPEVVNKLNDSIFSYLLKSEKIDTKDIDFAIKNPESKQAQAISYVVFSVLANPDANEIAKKLYKDFRDSGYDAIPDIYDRMTGTSNTASIILNPDKLTIKDCQFIDKQIYKNAKQLVKKYGNIKLIDAYKNELVVQ